MEEPFVDHFGSLELPVDATAAQIKKQYRKLALKYHPDKAADEKQRVLHEKKFHLITKARDVLTNPQERAAYERVLKQKAKQAFFDRKLDAETAKRKADLDGRERAAKRRRTEDHLNAIRKEQEMLKIKRETNRLREALQAKKDAAVVDKLKSKVEKEEEEQTPTWKRRTSAQIIEEDDEEDEYKFMVKARWKDKYLIHSVESIRDLFRPFGLIDSVVVGKRSAIITFLELESVEKALKASNIEDIHKVTRIQTPSTEASKSPSSTSTDPIQNHGTNTTPSLYKPLLKKSTNPCFGVSETQIPVVRKSPKNVSSVLMDPSEEDILAQMMAMG
eukprot:TRINITY_DN1170_c0_g1_i1.p1 TRINITY_DN1170_c0_g1~~TRINITY_DN1170_c0_g1_i1.p1  ORF type:complete len:332 (-),score=104.79 TRINITY_DN1170_c0_g1_i1:1783-2778(-)